MKVKFLIFNFLLLAVFAIMNMNIVIQAYSSNVTISKANFPDKDLRKLIKKEFDTNKDNTLSPKEIKKATELLISAADGSSSINMKGLSKLSSLTTLDIEIDVKNYDELKKLKSLRKLRIYNSDKNLNLNMLKQVKKLEINNKKLNTLILPVNLKELILDFTRITKLDVSGHKSLEYLQFLNCSKLNTINVSNCTKLETIISSELPCLKTLKLKNMKNLRYFTLDYAPKLKHFDFKETPALKEIRIEAPLKSCNVNYAGKLQDVDLKYIKAKKLDISKLYKLKVFTCRYSEVKKMILWKKTQKNLWWLYIPSNKLEGRLNLSLLPNLQVLSCDNNKLSQIYAKNNKKLTHVQCDNNQLKKLNLYNVPTSNLYVSCNYNAEVTVYLKNSNYNKDKSIFDSSATIIYKNK